VTDYPDRIGIGDGPTTPCRLTGMDFAAGGPIVSGVREPDGTFRIDRVSTPYQTFSEIRARIERHYDPAPNGCRDCGTEQRAHGPQHPYTEPPDTLRLARMKHRRQARLNPPFRITPPRDLLVTFTVHTEAMQRAFADLAEAMRPLGERMAAAGRTFREAAETAGGTAEPILASDLDWRAQGKVCCHVCGPDPGHCCDARATVSITHPLPSGGTRTLPLCGPCHQAEEAAHD
jgi:hypothetical protein